MTNAESRARNADLPEAWNEALAVLESHINRAAPVEGTALRIWGAFHAMVAIKIADAKGIEMATEVFTTAKRLMDTPVRPPGSLPHDPEAAAREIEKLLNERFDSVDRLHSRGDAVLTAIQQARANAPAFIDRVTAGCDRLRFIVEHEVRFPIELQQRVFVVLDEIRSALSTGPIPDVDRLGSLLRDLRALSKARGEPGTEAPALASADAWPVDLESIDDIDCAALAVLVEWAPNPKPLSSADIATRINRRYPRCPTSAEHLRQCTFPKLRPLLKPTQERRSRGQSLRPEMVSVAKAMVEAKTRL